MAIHQADLFEHAGMLVTPVGVINAPERKKQGVKWQVLDIIHHTDGVHFFFEDAFLKIDAGKGEVIVSFKIEKRIFQFHGNFSVVLDIDSKKPKRIISFEKIDFTTEFWQRVNTDILQEKQQTILTQVQIFILEKIWEKENPKVA